jgi:hypothetical protein
MHYLVFKHLIFGIVSKKIKWTSMVEEQLYTTNCLKILKMVKIKFLRKAIIHPMKCVLPNETSSWHKMLPHETVHFKLEKVVSLSLHKNQAQALVMPQDTRVRQNEFFASKNYPCPPPGPELNLVPYVNYVMPLIDDEMLYEYPMPSSQGRSRPSCTRFVDENEINEDEEEGEDDGEDEEAKDAESPPHPFA